MADDYVLKPFAPKVLLAKLDSLIKNRNRLRRIFCEKLDAIEVPVAELSAQDSFMQQLMELIRKRVHDPNLSGYVIELSMCIWISTSPGSMYLPLPSRSSTPGYESAGEMQ